MATPDDVTRADHLPSVDPISERRDALARVRCAGQGLQDAKTLRDLRQIEEAAHGVHRAVDAARDAGVAWGAIGDALGITRGNAYQRYRIHLPPN